MTIAPMAPSHVPGAVALQRACFPAPFPEELLWRPEHLMAHLAKFPDGQFVALAPGGEVVGSASASRISEDRWLAHLPWEEALGGFTFETFDPEGSTLYGADISVHPDWRGRGVGRALYQARFALVARLGLQRYGTACRLPGCLSSGLAPAAYVSEVVAARLTDRTLTPLLRYGLACTGVIEGYMPDEESGDAAALLEFVP